MLISYRGTDRWRRKLRPYAEAALRSTRDVFGGATNNTELLFPGDPLHTSLSRAKNRSINVCDLRHIHDELREAGTKFMPFCNLAKTSDDKRWMPQYNGYKEPQKAENRGK
jgi:hypothetical protein